MIASQTEFWTLGEIMVLFHGIPERELRAIMASNGVYAAGVRPAAGRGRPPQVYPAGAVCDALGSLL